MRARTFLRHWSLQRHLDCGKHERALEREALIDRAAVAYAERLEGQPSSLPETRVETNANTQAILQAGGGLVGESLLPELTDWGFGGEGLEGL